MSPTPTRAQLHEPTLFDLPHTKAPAPFSDRAYQVRGVHAIVSGLRHGGRGQAIMACGTGKTKVARWTAERVVEPGGIVVIAVPSVALVDQTLREWAEHSIDHRALAVCSDDTVQDDSTSSVIDILEPVTTDPDVISAWLRVDTGPACQLIVTTHHSAYLVGIGVQQVARRASLMVIDEAHHTAGRTDKRAALLHDDEVVPADRRLYMTATARVAASQRGAADVDLFSMDDEAVYGPVLFSYPFSEAIADGWLDDYRLAVIGVTQAEIAAVLRGGKLTGPQERAAKVHVALARAVELFGLSRIITFTRTVRDAKRFAETFPDTLAQLPPNLRPRRPLHADHTHGDMNVAQRRRILATLATPPLGGWTVVANARCLSEGVDVPTVDCVAFTSRKKSVVDIVQAVGRALRHDPEGSGVSTVIVPILLPDEDTDDAESVDAGEYEVLWEVVRALRAHDDSFRAELDSCRSSRFTDRAALRRIHFDLPGHPPDGELLRHLTVRLVKSATSPWWDSYDRLKEFHTSCGHVDVPVNYRCETDRYTLGQWTKLQRRAHKQKCLAPERIAALSALGFNFEDGGQQRRAKQVRQWNAALAAARQFHAEHGHLELLTDTVVNGINISKWIRVQRGHDRAGTLGPERRQALVELGVDFDPYENRWQRKLAAAAQFHAEHGHLRVSQGSPGEEGALAAWIARQRQLHKSGELEEAKVAALDRLAMTWDFEQEKWQRDLAVAAAFFVEHGHLHPAGAEHKDLMKWLGLRRRSRQHLSEAQQAELNAIGMIWDLDAARWDAGLAATRRFLEEFGNLNVPRGYMVDGLRGPSTLDLYLWLHDRRTQRREGTLGSARIAALDELGLEWSPRDAARERALRLCRAFHASHGHLRVPADYLDEGVRLGSWLEVRRSAQNEGTLHESEFAVLEELGFDWGNQVDLKWQRSYEAARAYHAEQGSLTPSRSYTTPGGLKLALWISDQRARRKEGSLTPERIALLDQLGMEWNDVPAHQRRWNERLAQARDYHARHGHLRIPIDAEGPGEILRRFLHYQRRLFRQGELAAERVAQLDKLEMPWDLQELQWSQPFSQAQAYYTEHGDLDVSSRWPASNGVDLYKWLGSQRLRHSAGLLARDREAALTAIGMRWEAIATGEKMWNRGWQHVLQYRREHGNFEVPCGYKTSCGFGLYGFVIRLHRDHDAGVLSAAKRSVLAEAGFVFRPVRRRVSNPDDPLTDPDTPVEQRWERGFALAKAFHAEHGHLDPDSSEPGQRQLARWLRNRRSSYAANAMPADRVAELNRIDMIWEVNKARWDAGVAATRRFALDHGHHRVPGSYRAIGTRGPGTLNLASWQHKQRANRRKNSLTAEQIAELDVVGFVWEPQRGRTNPEG